MTVPIPRPAREIADDLQRRIAAGEFARGERLPTYDQLADEYGSARRTVARAVNELRARGLVVGVQGSGVYAADSQRRPPRRYPEFVSYRVDVGSPVQADGRHATAGGFGDRPPHLIPAYGLGRRAEPVAAPGLDLHEDEDVAPVAHDDVDLDAWAAPVAVEQDQAPLDQVGDGDALAVAADRVLGPGVRRLSSSCDRRCRSGGVAGSPGVIELWTAGVGNCLWLGVLWRA